MAIIGDLVTRLSTDSKPFTAGIQQAQGSLKGFSATVKNNVASLAGALAGVGIGYALKEAVSSSLESVDAVSKLADAVGTTTQTLTGLQHAAQLSGTSSDVLNDSLKDLSKNLGEAVTGGGSAAKFLDSVGLSAKQLAAMDTGTAFTTIAEEISKLPTQAEKSAAAMQVFGEAGFRLLPMINQGGAGIRSMLKEAEQLGIAFDRADGAQVEKANDAILRMKQSVGGLATSMTIGIAPALTQMADGFRMMVPTVGNTFKTITQNVLTAFDVAGFGIANFGQIAELGFKSVALSVVSLAGEIQHTFTQTIPTLASWFADNWRDVFTTIESFTSAVFVNMAKNIQSVMTEVWNFLKSGGMDGIEVAWTPLTEGFRNAIKELPDIPERSMSALEKNLAADTEKLRGAIGGNLAEFLAEQARNRGVGIVDGLAKQFETPELKVDATNPDGNSGEGTKEGVAAGSLAGSKEAFDSILASQMAGAREKKDPNTPKLAAMESSLKELVRVAKNRNDGDVVFGGAF